MKKTAILLLFLFLRASAGFSAFDLKESGAASTAMADAVLSTVRDASSLFHNPGCLGSIADKGLLLTQAFPYGWDLLLHNSLAFVQPLPGGSFGVSFSYLGTLKDSDYVSQLDYSEIIVSAGCGRALPALPGASAGLVLRYLSGRSSRASSAGFSADLGFLWCFEFMNAALAVQDISLGDIVYSTGARETLNPALKAGVSTELIRNFIPSLDFCVKMKKAADPCSLALGLMYSYRWLAVRSGASYTGKDSLALNAGLGVLFPYQKGVTFDYAFSVHSGLDVSHVFSAGIKF